MLETANCIALRDYVGVGTNDLNRIKQAIEALVPVLKNVLPPPSIKNKASLSYNQGVILPRVVEVSCSITQRSSRREMRPFFYCEYPAQLLANMIRLVIVDNAWEDSFSFSSLRDKVVVAMGIDKSDLDLIQTIRVCNRKKGNASVCIQALACLLGSVVEEYYNKIITFGSPLYPISETIHTVSF